MLSVSEIIKRYSDDYLEHNKVNNYEEYLLKSITNCKTENNGYHVYKCQNCGEDIVSYNPCNNRHCPRCGGISPLIGHCLLSEYKQITSDTISVKVYFTIVDEEGNFINLDGKKLDANLDSNNFVITEANKTNFESFTLTYKLNENNIHLFII